MNDQGPKTFKDKGLKGCDVGTSARILIRKQIIEYVNTSIIFCHNHELCFAIITGSFHSNN